LNSLILKTVVRLTVPLILAVSAYLFFRGHNLPGGGFIAGMMFVSAGVLAVLSYGWNQVRKRIKISSLILLASGLLLAMLTGLGAMFLGYPFLTSAHEYHLPILGHVHFPTATFYDLGVCLLVIGALLTLMVGLGEGILEESDD